MRRTGWIGSMIAAALLLPASAGASFRLGPDITQPLPSGGFHFAALGCNTSSAPCTFLNLRSSNPDAVAAAPSAGVIVSWSVRAGCCDSTQTTTRKLTLGTFKAGTQDGAFGYGFAVPHLVGPSFELPPGNQILADTPLTLPARVPIAAGERVGVIADDPIGFSVYDTIPNVTTVFIAHTSVYNGEPYGGTYGVAFALSAVVEPDADGDGYGDETQDCAPTDPTVQGTGCAPPVVIPPPPSPISVGVNSGSSGSSGGSSSGVTISIPLPQTGAIPQSTDGIHFYIPLTCPKGATKPCGGYLVIVPSGATQAAKAKPVVYGRVTYSVAPGTAKRVRLTLNSAGRRALKRKGKLNVTLQIQPTSGKTTTVIRTLTAKRRQGR